MAKIQCEECNIESTITANTQEPVTYCPFCGEQVVFDDEQTDDDDEDDEGDDEDWGFDDEDDESDEDDDY